jgi:hypothetical protein
MPLYAALCDLAELVLNCSCTKLPKAEVSLRADVPQIGGAVDLSSTTASLRVGVLAEPHDCRALAQRLLGGSAEEHSDATVRGAMCELAYLLAGGVKRRLAYAGSFSVGAPYRLDGTMPTKAGWMVHTSVVKLDSISATLLWAARDESEPPW